MNLLPIGIVRTFHDYSETVFVLAKMNNTITSENLSFHCCQGSHQHIWHSLLGISPMKSDHYEN